MYMYVFTVCVVEYWITSKRTSSRFLFRTTCNLLLQCFTLYSLIYREMVILKACYLACMRNGIHSFQAIVTYSFCFKITTLFML
jgi:hypothetical protein